MSSYLNVFVEKMKQNKLVTCAVSVIIVSVLVMVNYFANNGKADASYESLQTTVLSSLSGAQKELSISGHHVIKGDRKTYDDIHLTITNDSVIYLENVRIRLTDDKPFISCSGTGNDLEYTIVLVGDSIIESTYEGATMPIISLEGYDIVGTLADPILGNKKQYYSSSKILTITDKYENSSYGGTLTLVNAPNTVSAVIGTVSADLVTPPGTSQGWVYEYDFYGCGEVRIKEKAELNIVNRGIGAAIGGGGIIDGGTTGALGGGKTIIDSGTVRIVLPEGSHGTAIGGGAAMLNVNGTLEPSQTGLAGEGADVEITGGSLFIENKGQGQNFGTGLGKVDDTVYAGSLTDGIGNPLELYIAEVYKDEATMPSGKFDNFDEINENYGEFPLINVSGSQDYTYEIWGAYYEGHDRPLYATRTLTNAEKDYHYFGEGYASTLYDISGNQIITEDLTGRLFFWLPSTPAQYYDIEVDGFSAQTVKVTTYVDDEAVTTARNGAKVKLLLELDKDYEVTDVYYTKSGSNTEYPMELIDGEYYFDMPSGDVTIYVETILPEYTITYMNDMEAKHGNPTSYTAKDKIILKNPSVLGNTFRGWTDAEGNIVTEISEGTTGDIVLYANWEQLVYTVTFVDYDGTVLLSQATNYGGTVTPPTTPVRENYKFTGWDRDFSYVTADITVKAVYIEDIQTPVIPEEPEEPEEPKGPFNVIIDSSIANGSVTSDVTGGLEGEEVTLSIKAAAGYKLKQIKVVRNDETGATVAVNQFQAVGDNPALTGEYTYLFTMPAADVTVYAEFEMSQYTIAYVNVGNNDHGNPTVYNMTDAFTLNNPTKDGFIFLGWEDPDGNVVTEITAGTTGNLVLVGKWETEVVISKYKVHLNRGIKNGVIVSSHETADENELITITATPDEGYRLKAIKYVLTGDLTAVSTVIENTSSETNEISFYMPAEDIIVTAEFEPIRYNLIYVDVDSHNNPASYTIEDAFQFNIPVKDGYIFEKWYDVDGNQVTGIKEGTIGNKVIIATWKKAPVIPSIYSIKVDEDIRNGSVYVDKDTASEGDEINVSVKAEDGYKLGLLEFVPEETEEVAPAATYSGRNRLYLAGDAPIARIALTAALVPDNNYVFTMPASNILVKATFVEKPVMEEPSTDKSDVEETTTDKQDEEETTTGKSDGEEPTTGKTDREELTTDKTIEETPTAGGPVDNDIGDVGSDGEVKTGDDNRPVLYIIIAIFALLAMLAAFFYKEKEKEDYEL